MHLQVVQVVTFIIAFSLAATRILNASKWFWGSMPPVVSGLLPGLVIALPALVQGVTGAQSWTDLAVAFLAAGALVLPGTHSHTVVVAKPNGPGSSSLGAAILLLGFGLSLAMLQSACASLGSAFSWPDAVSCAPTPEGLLSKVEDILLAGGDYESALKQLALTDGKSAVECAVDKFDKSFGPNTPDQAAARARGRAFLDKTGTKVAQ